MTSSSSLGRERSMFFISSTSRWVDRAILQEMVSTYIIYKLETAFTSKKLKCQLSILPRSTNLLGQYPATTLQLAKSME